MKKKNKPFYTCCVCDKQAVYNLQNVWKLYDIIGDDGFQKNDEWEGDANEFYCEKHYQEEMDK